ncbi:hypothetical protein Pth03_74980 [Planotetraspora thailandica]|uniref:Insertion element IS150 protein InsJ-like helix-turn-helix domain-containing protein n=1 Tax=Planotetraspora thailandica TaxID=487172 RepID=A0A8J3Y1K2_9ACTN|nr:hypothetical protein Pth03_74980 [Planotetraspora thailandica]
MALVDMSVVEQRYRAVLAVLAGASVTEVAREVGVARQTLSGCVSRYRESGLGGLVDRSRRPHSGSTDLRHRDAEDVGKFLDDREPINRAYSTFDLRHPALGPAHEAGELDLRPAKSLAVVRDALTDELRVRHQW